MIGNWLEARFLSAVTIYRDSDTNFTKSHEFLKRIWKSGFEDQIIHQKNLKSSILNSRKISAIRVKLFILYYPLISPLSSSVASYIVPA